MSARNAKKVQQVSVLIPAYQSGNLLDEAIESVLAQDYSNLQIVICDDGSQGFQAERVSRLIPEGFGKDHVIIHNKKNVGTVRNLNGGLKRCTGNWVLLLAADDKLVDGSVISSLVNYAEETGCQWVLGRTMLCDKNLQFVGNMRPTNAQVAFLKSSDATSVWSQLCRNCFLPSSGNFYCISLLRDMGGFDEQYYVVEDWPLFLRMIRNRKVPELLDIPTVLHRAKGLSQSQAGKNHTYQRDLINVMDREIHPYLGILPDDEKKEVTMLCQDKKAIYEFRFHCNRVSEKLRWLLSNRKVLIRKMQEKGERFHHDKKL